MEKDMQSYRLSDLVKIKNGKDHKMLSNGKYPVLGSGGIMRYVDKFLYDKPSVLLPRKGTLDNIQYCDMPFWTVDTLYYTEVNTNLANPYYLYRYLSLLDLSNLDSGTGVPSMTFDNYYGLKIFLPNIEKQTKIAQILQTLDKKITINRQINQNLEAMAKLLYDYWFVQFDFPNEEGKPYKSSGGEMVWNEKLKRDIPASWKTKAIEDIADVYNGATPSTVNEQNYGGDIVWITPKDLSDQKQKFVYQGERNISQAGYNSCSTHLLPPNTILMSSRAPIGLLSIAKTELCTNQGFKSFVPQAENISTYLYYYLNIHIKQIEQLGTGTTFKEVSREDVLKFPILKPSDAILDLWEERVSAFNNKQFEIQKGNEYLTKQRDELLPLLMNGQVSVNSDLSVYKKKRRGRIPSLTLNQVSDIQIFHRQSIVVLTEQVLMDELQPKNLIILIVITFGTEVSVTVAWHVFLEETSQVFQTFGLVLLEVAAHNDDAPVGEVASSFAVLPEADVAVQITLTDVHTKAIGILHHATTVSVAELLTQVEIEIKN